MKKVAALILAVSMSMILMLSVANADSTEHGFRIHVQCVSDATNDVFYLREFYKKTGSGNAISIKHSCVNSTNYTNLFAAHRQDTGLFSGSKFLASDYVYHDVTSGAVVKDKYYSIVSRGNTKHNVNHGLTSVTLDGKFKVN